MVTKAKKRGKAKRKVLAEKASRARRKTGKLKRPKKKVLKEIKPVIYAVIRIRGSVNTKKELKDNLDMLRLNRVNQCVLIPSSPSFVGMVRKAENSVTWGEISRTTLEKLIFKRGFIEGKPPGKERASELAKKIISADKAAIKKTGIKPVFRLNPPSKGFRSTRMSYPKGDLGYRGERINDLLKRMI